MITMDDRIRGGLYGVAVGDALGATLEFMTKEQIQARYGGGGLRDIVGGGWLRLRPGEWTDDTEMTLAVAEGIIKDPDNPVPHIGEGFLRWRATNPPDIGATIRAAFHAYDMLNDWGLAAEEVHKRGGRTAGNGALMRTLPLAFVYADVMLYVRAVEIARMTHWDIEAGLTCYLYCRVAQGLLNGRNFEEAYVEALLSDRGVCDFAVRKLESVLERREEWLRPTGYTVDTLACALWCAANTGSFEEAVVKAVNLGGDADTVGAVTGGLAGVMYGFDAIPVRWRDAFDTKQRERLDSAVSGLDRLTRSAARIAKNKAN